MITGPVLDVHVDWRGIADDDDAWTWNLALYGIVEPRTRSLVYLGKADGSTLRQRWCRAGAKADFWRWYEANFRNRRHLLFAGEFVASTARLTRQLVADVESLLIHRLRPLGNVASVRSRIARPGLRVMCSGDWPASPRVFLDNLD